MRVSSSSASLVSREPTSLVGHEFGKSQTSAWSLIKRYFNRLDRHMTAIAYAEAGNLDAVQQILDENKAMKELELRASGNSGMQRR